MNLKFLLNLKILAILGFAQTAFALGLEYSDVGCVSCPYYRNCYTYSGISSEETCENGRECNAVEMYECWLELKDRLPKLVNECTRPGVFPDPEDDSKYYVCFGGPNGLQKYNFECPRGFYFCEARLTCERDMDYYYYDYESDTIPTEPPEDETTRPPTSATPEVTSVPLTTSEMISTTVRSTTPTTTTATPSTTPSKTTTTTTTTTPPTTPSKTTTTTTTSPTTPSNTTTTTTTSPTTPSNTTTTTTPPTTPSKTTTTTTPPTTPSTTTTTTTTTSPTTPSTTTTTTTTTSTTPSKTTTTTTPPTTPSTTTTTTTTTSPTTPSTTTTTATPSTTPSKTTTTTTTTPPKTPPTTTTTTTTTPTTPPKPVPFICKTSGVFPNPDNCKAYYKCSASLKPFQYYCPGASYFNEQILKCSVIITPSCQSQISKNSTTLSSSLVVSDETTVLSSISTTLPETSEAPSEELTTLEPFSCRSRGIFPDPSDCKTYYRCTRLGKKYTYTCPRGTFFNEISKHCTPKMPLRCRT